MNFSVNKCVGFVLIAFYYEIIITKILSEKSDGIYIYSCYKLYLNFHIKITFSIITISFINHLMPLVKSSKNITTVKTSKNIAILLTNKVIRVNILIYGSNIM